MSRYSHAVSILGQDAHTLLKERPILVVGAGGIGSELLKNLVLVGFSNITIVDLDTIDLSNLNRQFLFRKPDISKPKATVAAATALQFNPSVAIDARHANIKDPEFDALWFKRFGAVFGALDNLDARRHVNKMCMSAGVPLIESGTAGYLGQVQPIVKDVSECFDCQVKPTPKTFPVCTIRSTPSTPIHCIVWAKSYLFVQLFGEDDESADSDELDKAKADGENAAEIENLKKEATAFRAVRRALGDEGGAKAVFEKVFKADINRLLGMEDMWLVQGRVKPTPLEYDSILSDTFVFPTPKAKKASAAAAPPPPAGQASTSKDAHQLKDQRQLSLKENVLLFTSSCDRLAARVKADPTISLAFDKDDDDTLDFVTATSNLRSYAYGIEPQTRFKIKEMAGNIIPAIATTNAIIAGLIVFQALKVLTTPPASYRTSLFNVNLQAITSRPLQTLKLQTPLPTCGVCRDVYVVLPCDPARLTLGDVLDKVVKSAEGGLGFGSAAKVSVYEGGRLLAEPSYGDDEDEDGLQNEGRTLEDLEVGVGKWLTVVDEEDEEDKRTNVVFAICALPSSPDRSSDQTFELSLPLPIVPLNPQPAAPPPLPAPPAAAETSASSSGKKRALDVDDADGIEVEGGSSAKRAKTGPSSSSKGGAKEEDDGVIVLDEDDEDDGIISLE